MRTRLDGKLCEDSSIGVGTGNNDGLNPGALAEAHQFACDCSTASGRLVVDQNSKSRPANAAGAATSRGRRAIARVAATDENPYSSRPVDTALVESLRRNDGASSNTFLRRCTR